MSTRVSLEQIRDALMSCALAAYDDALVRGLCAEGAREAAIGAMRRLDLSEMAGSGTSQITTRLRAAIERYFAEYDDLAAAVARMRDPADAVLDWDEIRRDLLAAD